MSDRPDGQLQLIADPNPRQPAGVTPEAVLGAFDPARVTQARHLRGMTKKAVADALGVSPAAIGQYETGVARPRPDLLLRLATTLRVPLGFFVIGRPHARLAATNAHFRSLRSTRVYQRDKAIATVEQVWELANELERYVELPAPQVPRYDCSEDHPGDGAPFGPEAAAQAIRRQWNLGMGPVQYLVRRLEANGVIVVAPAPDPDSITVDAFSTSGLPRPIMVLTSNRADDVYRHRFTAAHELGHLVLHHEGVGTDVAREREADRFAAEFLTPRDSIISQLPRRLDLRRLAELSRTWGVSVHSLLFRSRETGLLSDSAASRGYQRLHALKDQSGFRPEPVDGFPHEQPIMLMRALELAAESGLTMATLAHRLGWTIDRCRELLGVADQEQTNRPRLQLLTGGEV